MKHIDKKLAINKVLSEMKWKKVDMATSGTNCQYLEDNYPVSSLPDLLRDAALCIHEEVKVPFAIVANSLLFAITFIAQKHVNAITIQKVVMPCSINFLSEANSGDRKSTADYFALKVINDIQSDAIAKYSVEYANWEKLPHKERANVPQPKNPKRIFSDSTLEPIVGGFIRGEFVNIAISSNDAADFLCGYALNSDNSKPNMVLLTKVFDIGYVERKRSKGNAEGSGVANHIRLSMHLMAQPIIIQEVFSNKTMSSIGLLPRFIYAAPPSLAGTRFLKIDDIDKDITLDRRLINYYDQCKKLLGDWYDVRDLTDQSQLIDNRKVLRLSNEAKPVFVNIFNEIEAKIKPNNIYVDHKAEASRAGELIIRLATVFAFFKEEKEITVEDLKHASNILNYSLNQWVRSNKINNDVTDADQLLNFLVKHYQDKNEEYILKSSIGQNCRNFRNRTGKRDQAIQYLEEIDNVRTIIFDGKEYVVLNPIFLKKDLNG